MSDSIDSFSFLSLKGTPRWPVEQNKLIQRAGVDGSAFLLMGRRCKPFELVSTVDTASMALGAALLLSYQALTESGLVVLVKGDVDWSDADLWVKVLDVQLRSLKAAALVVGGLNPPSVCMLEAVWTLQGVEYTGAGGS